MLYKTYWKPLRIKTYEIWSKKHNITASIANTKNELRKWIVLMSCHFALLKVFPLNKFYYTRSLCHFHISCISLETCYCPETGSKWRIKSYKHEKTSFMSYNLHAFSPTVTQSKMWDIGYFTRKNVTWNVFSFHLWFPLQFLTRILFENMGTFVSIV